MTDSQQPQYEPPLIRRAHIAILVSGIIVSLSVGLAGMTALSLWGILFGPGSAPHYQSQLDVPYVFWSTVSHTAWMAAFNWYLFILVIPVSWIVIGILSVAFKAERHPQPAIRFYIVGLIATSSAILFASLSIGLGYMRTDFPQYLLATIGGGAIAALSIGVPAGLFTTFIYRIILRPPAYPPNS